MSVVITLKYLDEHRTERGSWTYMQMAALGVKCPQPPGWRQALEGVEISDDQARAFEAAKFVFSAKTIRKQNARKAELLTLMGKEVPPELLPPPQPPLSAKAQRKAEKRAKRKAARLAKAQELERKLSAPKPINQKPVRAVKPVKQPREPARPPAYSGDVTGDAFLLSYQWRRLRMEALRHYGPRCMCCGATPENGATMNVDHIKPRKTHPHLAMDFENLQILCHDCNHGKGNWDTTDWRPATDGVSTEVQQFIRSIARESKA